jgi:putative Mn2+ efflux pump MntP
MFDIFLIALALGVDAFSVAVVAGACFLSISLREKWSLILHFGFFQFIMTVIGFFLGDSISYYIKAFDHWVILLLLGLIGTKLIYDSFTEKEQESNKLQKDFFSEKNILLLSIATSIDALAIGISFSIMEKSVFFPSIILGIVAAIMSFIGISLGKKIGSKTSRSMQVISGIVLIAIGIKVFLEHTI